MSDPAPPPPTDLATAFAKPSRASQLHMPPRRPQPATRPAPASSPPPGEPPTPAKPVPAPTQILVLYTPESIRTRMRAVQAAKRTTFMEQVLDAIEATIDDLDHLIHERTQPATIKGRLFERKAPPAPVEETKVQVTIRGALPSQLHVIDQLVEQTGAPNRSALITAALDHHLPVRPRAMR